MNQLAPKGREAFLAGDAAWDSDVFKVVLVKAAYVFSAAHDNLDDVAAGNRIATSVALTGKTTTDGVADADDVTFTALAAGNTIAGFWIFKDTGVEATSRLIAFFDTKADATPISVPTNGGDVVIVWSNGAEKIFKI